MMVAVQHRGMKIDISAADGRYSRVIGNRSFSPMQRPAKVANANKKYAIGALKALNFGECHADKGKRD
jgi:hypothetical protein